MRVHAHRLRGLQGHFNSNSPVPADFRASLQRFADLGVDVQITELDIEGAGTAQANSYARGRGMSRRDRCTGITVWGVTDKYSWRSTATFAALRRRLPGEARLRRRPVRPRRRLAAATRATARRAVRPRTP